MHKLMLDSHNKRQNVVVAHSLQFPFDLGHFCVGEEIVLYFRQYVRIVGATLSLSSHTSSSFSSLSPLAGTCFCLLGHERNTETRKPLDRLATDVMRGNVWTKNKTKRIK